MPNTRQAASHQTAHFAAEGLQCFRGERLLFENLSFDLTAQQCLHIIGCNGSGKSSLLRIIGGLLDAEQGQLKWQAETINHNSDYLANIAYLGHKDALKNQLSTIENLRFYQHLNHRPDENRLDECLHRLGLLESADLLSQQLSFGQRRRLSFARLLLKRSPLWILDEPFTGIDQQGRELVESLCVEHLQQGGAIILSNHQSLQNSSLAPYLKELRL